RAVPRLRTNPASCGKAGGVSEVAIGGSSQTPNPPGCTALCALIAMTAATHPAKTAWRARWRALPEAENASAIKRGRPGKTITSNAGHETDIEYAEPKPSEASRPISTVRREGVRQRQRRATAKLPISAR